MTHRQGGYDFPEKQQYRDRVWQSMRSNRDRTIARFGNYLMLPGLSNLEIQTAQRYGFYPGPHLILVDENPAVVATLKKQFPETTTIGLPVVRAITERIKARTLSAANLDFCSNLSARLERELEKIGSSAAWTQVSTVAVTVLRGRENPEFLRERSKLGGGGEWVPHTWLAMTRTDYGAFWWDAGVTLTDAIRLTCIERALLGRSFIHCSTLMHGGTYRSGKQTMLWGFWKISRSVATRKMAA